MFRLVAVEKGRDPYGQVLENLGAYNPHSKELAAKAERIKYWLSKGAQMSATVNNLLIEKKIIEGKKATASKAGEKSAKRLAQINAKTNKKAVREATPAKTSSTSKMTAEEKSTETPIEIPTEAPEKNAWFYTSDFTYWQILKKYYNC